MGRIPTLVGRIVLQHNSKHIATTDYSCVWFCKHDSSSDNNLTRLSFNRSRSTCEDAVWSRCLSAPVTLTFTDDLDIWTRRRYSEDVPAYQKWSF